VKYLCVAVPLRPPLTATSARVYVLGTLFRAAPRRGWAGSGQDEKIAGQKVLLAVKVAGDESVEAHVWRSRSSDSSSSLVRGSSAVGRVCRNAA
jgi:hypothetical protein